MNNTSPNSTETASKHARKRTAAQRAADLRYIEDKHLRGKSHASIAEMLSAERGYSISRQQVAYDLKGLAEIWAAEAKELIAGGKAQLLKSLAAMETALWDSWEQSRRPNDLPLPQPSASPRGKNSKSNFTGDPAYMKLILEIQDRRAQLLGLEKTSGTGAIDPRLIPEQTLPQMLTDEVQAAILERHYRRTRGSNYVPPADTNREIPSI